MLRIVDYILTTYFLLEVYKQSVILISSILTYLIIVIHYYY